MITKRCVLILFVLALSCASGCRRLPGKPSEADRWVAPSEISDFDYLYRQNCAGCHGTLNRKPNTFGASFYPPAPNLISDPPDDPEWHVFYTIRTGVRYTGMPSWEKTLSKDDMWKVTMFLSHMEKLPPAVQQYWKTSFGAGHAPDKKETDHEHH